MPKDFCHTDHDDDRSEPLDAHLAFPDTDEEAHFGAYHRVLGTPLPLPGAAAPGRASQLCSASAFPCDSEAPATPPWRRRGPRAPRSSRPAAASGPSAAAPCLADGARGLACGSVEPSDVCAPAPLPPPVDVPTVDGASSSACGAAAAEKTTTRAPTAPAAEGAGKGKATRGAGLRGKGMADGPSADPPARPCPPWRASAASPAKLSSPPRSAPRQRRRAKKKRVRVKPGERTLPLAEEMAIERAAIALLSCEAVITAHQLLRALNASAVVYTAEALGTTSAFAWRSLRSAMEGRDDEAYREAYHDPEGFSEPFVPTLAPEVAASASLLQDHALAILHEFERLRLPGISRMLGEDIINCLDDDDFCSSP